MLETYSLRTTETPLEQAALDILSNAPARPQALHIAALATKGFGEQHLHSAGAELGYQPPIMHKTLGELDRILPYLSQTTAAVARRYGKAPVRLFADRDADLMHDHYAVTHPEDDRAHLMPASMYLLRSYPMMQRPDLAKPFLEKYDITPEVIEASAEPLALIDTGYVGRVREVLCDVLQRTYGYTTAATKAMTEIALLCPTWPSTQGVNKLIDVTTSQPDEILKQFPRVQEMISQQDDSLDFYLPTFPIATSMQVMPRFHGAYMGLLAKDGEVIPFTNPQDISNDVDTMLGRSEDSGNANYSIVNPLAAAIVQLRVVRHALRARKPG